MKKPVRSVLAIILSISICLGGMIMSSSVTANAAVSDYETNLSLTAAKEGMVLLKNDNNCLPLASGNRKIALFGGAGAMRTGTTGTGAESNRPGYTVSVYDGLKNAGFTITTENWLKAYDAEYEKGFSQWEYTPWDHFNLPEFSISQTDLATAANGTDTAVYVIRRLAGEGSDRKVEKGDYLLSDNELNNLTAIANTFDKVVLILNTCGPIDLSFLDTISNIDSIIYASLPGMEGGNAVASILTGETNPSGKLSATWAKTYNDYPSAQAFMNINQQILSEDIYVGYRWFETFEGESQKVAFPFGFGLSYTNFTFTNAAMSVVNGQVKVSVTVTNSGAVAGKEVVQVYYGAPQGKLGKPAVSLAAYKKTELLSPGQSQVITLTYSLRDMASYDDEGFTGNPSCYVLEAGEYPVYIGNCAATAKNLVAGVYTQNALQVIQQLNRYGAPVTSFNKVINTKNGRSTVTVTANHSTAELLPADSGKHELTNTTGQAISYSQLLADPRKIDDYIGQFDTPTLAEYLRLVSGQGAGIVGGANLQADTPELVLCDGVTGLNYDHTKSASYPSPTCLAQTFNDELVTRVAAAVADQFIQWNFDNVLAPGVNIQQNPLCGRNFGYFSEDPLLSGKMGAAYVRGTQSKGIGATPKHFAVNTKEDNRSTVDSILSERALREIYLRSFQITVQESEPWSIMTSYNKINGTEAAERSDLINGVLRNEWGFDGVVMTDWGNNSNEAVEKVAGCDLNCFGTSASADILINAVNNGHLSKAALQQAAKNILKLTMKSYQNYKNGIYAGIQTIYQDRASTIEAEAFNGKSQQAGDVGFEDCGDIGGGKNPTNTNQGKVLYYSLQVELAGTYRLIPRVAAVNTNGYLQFAVNGTPVGETPHFVASGGWQTYADQPYVDIVLPQGACELAVTCMETSYNINYFTLEPIELAETVTVVHRPQAIQVSYNTPAAQLTLPTQVTITLSDGSRTTAAVAWNTDTYRPLQSGTQTISGTITPPEGVYNTGNLLAYIPLVVAENPNPVTKVTITNAPSVLKQGSTHAFTVSVDGQGNYIRDVIWSVNSYTSTITGSGVLTVAADEFSKTLVITATSVTDDAVLDTVTVSIIKNKLVIAQDQPTRLLGVQYHNGSRVYNTEDCLDATGGKNIMDFNNNGWIEYECNVKGGGTYDVTFRYAAVTDQSSKIQLTSASGSGESPLLAATGGWQIWETTQPVRITLSQGEQLIRLTAIGSGFNFNYMELTPVDVTVITTHLVSGTVSGTEDPTKLTVSLNSANNHYQVSPDAKGKFSINAVAGNYTLTVSGKGVNTHTQSITVNKDTPLSITLTQAEKNLISATLPTRLFGVDYDEGSRPYGTEQCEDTTGGENIKDFNDGHWIDFDCKIEGSGTFSMTFRYASPVDKTSSLKILCDNTLLTESDLLATTGGWQSWASTEPKTITLPAGEHTIRLQANGNNFNFNYMELTPVNVVIPTTYKLKGTITGVENLSKLNVTLQGKHGSLQTTPDQSGFFAFDDLDKGEYLLSVKGDGIEDYTQTITVPVTQNLNITVTPIAVNPVIPYGDVDEDGIIRATDALQVLKSVVGNVVLTGDQTVVADVDGNGKISSVDALYILKKVVGKIDRFPIEEK